MSKKILIIITVVFFSAMLFLSLFSERIHNAGLPEVTVARPETYTFEETYTDENGEAHTVYTDKTAITKEQLEKGVYVLYSAEKNGTKRNFVHLAQVVTGVEKDGYFEIVSGLNWNEKIITEHSGELYDGCEVYIK